MQDRYRQVSTGIGFSGKRFNVLNISHVKEKSYEEMGLYCMWLCL